MTETQILDALRICSTYGAKCTDCPAFIKADRSKCRDVLSGAIEIIEHLKKEVAFASDLLELERAKSERLIAQLIDYSERLAGETK